MDLSKVTNFLKEELSKPEVIAEIASGLGSVIIHNESASIGIIRDQLFNEIGVSSLEDISDEILKRMTLQQRNILSKIRMHEEDVQIEKLKRRGIFFDALGTVISDAIVKLTKSAIIAAL